LNLHRNEADLIVDWVVNKFNPCDQDMARSKLLVKINRYITMVLQFLLPCVGVGLIQLHPCVVLDDVAASLILISVLIHLAPIPELAVVWSSRADLSITFSPPGFPT
jgi:hypothetical protein